MLSTLRGGNGSRWSPRSLPGLIAWYYAHPSFWVMSSESEITTWLDRSDTKSDISTAGGSHPSPGIWSPGVYPVDFDGAVDFLTTTTAPIATLVSGTDIPFSLLITMQINASNDHGVAEWLSGGNGLVQMRTNNAPPEQLRIQRRDDAATSVTVTGALDVGTTPNRHAFIFPGTTVTTIRGRDIDNNASAMNVGATTLTEFRLGRSTIGQLDGKVTECVIYNRAITVAEWQQYVWYSLGEFGA